MQVAEEKEEEYKEENHEEEDNKEEDHQKEEEKVKGLRKNHFNHPRGGDPFYLAGTCLF